jgi:hypothetical protein
MALDFPPGTPGATTPGPGGVVWQWDGVKWIALSSGAASYLPTSGGTLTGPLILAADPLPTAPLGAATKQYADAGSAAAEHNVGRNVLHNGLMNVTQRGTGPWTTNGAYTADRWIMGLGAGDANSVAIVAVADSNRAQIGDEAAQSMLLNQFTGAAGASNYAFFNQPIENVRRLANKTVTVSFWATASAAGMKLGVSVDQGFGTGGSPSGAVLGSGQAVTLTTVFSRYTVTFTLPSVAGMTLGTNGNSATSLNFWLSAGSNNATRSGNVGVQSGNIWLWGVQLELGGTATPLEKLDPRVDLANAQRFYQVGALYFSAYSAAGIALAFSMTLSEEMRATPTMNFASPSFSNLSGAAIAALNATGFYVTGTAIGAAACVWNSGYSASADL